MSCEDPDNRANWPRNMFVWRSNILGSSGKGHEYFLKHLLGTTHGVQGKGSGQDDAKPRKCAGTKGPEGKLDLLVTLDFRLSTTCLVFRHRAAHGHLVREERPQHQRHASLHPPVVGCRGARLGHAATGRSTKGALPKKFR